LREQLQPRVHRASIPLACDCWPSDIEAWTQQDLKDYFAIGYAPNNCTMVVVGDVTVARVMELAKKYIEPFLATILLRRFARKSRTVGERRIVVKKARSCRSR